MAVMMDERYALYTSYGLLGLIDGARTMPVFVNRNFKRPFCLGRNVPKTSLTDQSPDFTVRHASVHLARRV